MTLDLIYHEISHHPHLRAKIAPGPTIPHAGNLHHFYYVGEGDNAIRLRVSPYDFPVTASFPPEIQISSLTYTDNTLLVGLRNTTGHYDAFQFFSGSINMQELTPPHFGHAQYIGMLHRDGTRHESELWTGKYQFYAIKTSEKPLFLRTYIHLEPSFKVIDSTRHFFQFLNDNSFAAPLPTLLNTSIIPSLKKIEEGLKSPLNKVPLKNDDFPLTNNTLTFPTAPVSSFTVKSDENHHIPVHYYKAPNAKGLLLYIHGGPHAYVDPGNFSFDILNQAFLQQGYSYARLEPRGSTGGGHNYTAALVNHWNDVDVKDVMAVASHLKDTGYQSIFLTGESYGGFLTAAVMGKNSSFFKGAAPLMGVYDWGLYHKNNLKNRLKTRETDALSPLDEYIQSAYASIENNLWSRRLGFDPLQNTQRDREISPVYWVENITRPILLIHGSKDTTCYPDQFWRYFYAAKHYGRNITGILVLNESHSFSTNEMIQTYAMLMVDWFDAILSERYTPPDEISFFEMKNYTEDATRIISSFRK